MILTTALNLDNPVFRVFLGHAGAVLLKTSLMSILTAFVGITKKIYRKEEATARFTGAKRILAIARNADIERIRRSHVNDLENVLPFVLLGLLYVTTGPTQGVASLHFRIFTISRFIHTFVYVTAIPQPARALAFFTGFLINVSMAYSVISQAAF